MSSRRQLSALLLGLVGGVLAGLLRRRPAPVPALDHDAPASGTASSAGDASQTPRSGPEVVEGDPSTSG